MEHERGPATVLGDLRQRLDPGRVELPAGPFALVATHVQGRLDTPIQLPQVAVPAVVDPACGPVVGNQHIHRAVALGDPFHNRELRFHVTGAFVTPDAVTEPAGGGVAVHPGQERDSQSVQIPHTCPPQEMDPRRDLPGADRVERRPRFVVPADEVQRRRERDLAADDIGELADPTSVPLGGGHARSVPGVAVGFHVAGAQHKVEPSAERAGSGARRAGGAGELSADVSEHHEADLSARGGTLAATSSLPTRTLHHTDGPRRRPPHHTLPTPRHGELSGGTDVAQHIVRALDATPRGATAASAARGTMVLVPAPSLPPLDRPRRDTLAAALTAAGADASVAAAPANNGTDARQVYRDALDALVCSAHPDRGLRVLLVGSQLGAELMPEVAALDMAVPVGVSHKDNLAHSLQVCAQAPAERTTRWGALCHDLGKPPTRKVSGGEVTFHHHEAVGAKLTERMLARLGFEDRFATRVARLVALSGRTHGFDDSWTDAALRRVATDAGDLLGAVLDLARADCTSVRPGRREQVARQVDRVAARLEQIRVADERGRVRPALNGNQIAAHLGIEPGPELGAAYGHLRDLALTGQHLSGDEARHELDRWWASRG